MAQKTFEYKVDRFDDIEVLRYEVKGFEQLTRKQKALVYCLAETALWGRDILFDQNYGYNLVIRKTLDAVYRMGGVAGDTEWEALKEYTKKVWFANGIHHHYAMKKFVPKFSEAYFRKRVGEIAPEVLGTFWAGTADGLAEMLVPIVFDETIAPMRVSLDGKGDLLKASACHYYENISEAEAEAYYKAQKEKYQQEHPERGDELPSFGMNATLKKLPDGRIVDAVWRVDGVYSIAIKKIVEWLERAKAYAENERQRDVIGRMVKFYETGDPEDFDAYSTAWVKDTEGLVDFVNGFIETYGDPLGIKASWEGLVNFKDVEAGRRTETLSRNALWFEQHAPIDDRFRKSETSGVSAKVITAAMLGGDCYPATPIGINLPNANWIRKRHGSKSVTLENITEAYAEAARGNGFDEEFLCEEAQRERKAKYGILTDSLHTDLHECIGHGSGKLLPDTDPDALKAYGATIEEARADLYGLYYIADEKMVELGLLPDTEAYKTQYDTYMLNGLMTQLARIEPGEEIQESHMRNRALIARWALAHCDEAVEFGTEAGKTYVHIHNYKRLREAYGTLLREVQRIRSEGDYEAARELVETYGVKVDARLHEEVRQRYGRLGIAPYKGFVNPRYVATLDAAGEIADVRVAYDEGYEAQMLRYGAEYGAL